MVSAFIGLGSNLGTPLEQLQIACQELSAHPSIKLCCCSPWYGSSAVGPGTQPDYINGVAAIETNLSALELLTVMQQIELKHGRERNVHWGARTLDLDLLWFDNRKISLPNLEVPHPRIYERNFVLFPLRDIAPDIEIGNRGTVAYLAGRLSSDGIWRHTHT